MYELKGGDPGWSSLAFACLGFALGFLTGKVRDTHSKYGRPTSMGCFSKSRSHFPRVTDKVRHSQKEKDVAN